MEAGPGEVPGSDSAWGGMQRMKQVVTDHEDSDISGGRRGKCEKRIGKAWGDRETEVETARVDNSLKGMCCPKRQRLDFSGDPVGKTSASNTGGEDLIPGQGAKEASLVTQMVKIPPAMQETRVQSLGQKDPLEKEMASHSSILAWRIPRTEEPGGLQSTGSQRVRHD